MAAPATQSGSLVCVGLGMLLGAHLGPRSRNQIEEADVVFVAASDALVELWVQQIRPDARSLQPFYADGKSRRRTYAEMVEAMLVEVRAGRRVCAAFYGHPGVFARAPHAAVARARAEGFVASMEPGISAEDCLYADLGIDPGEFGCQHFEATQFLLHRRRVDPSAHLVLWQVAQVGDRSLGRFETGAPYRRLLVERLAKDYPLEHEVIIYEAATLPIDAPRVERRRLDSLPNATLHMHSTLVVPPSQPLEADTDVLAKLVELDEPSRASAGKPSLFLVSS
ncbi:SAM-dependent methyltransferase [Cognatilysobacter bugurensis]|uniref:Tetrapyrrole methylase domain-containing protein n=1 Tax=Cognatilysobacter bugurensis TaxID=543356 RepID=A0A918T3X9_9GAMM|nr:SAM-dependent methyltransferase [Lysobacter bugurensis]GHA88148.1 hypothetical protein GCM10007067_27730 [Lysobacter bugurensis]